MPRAWLWPPAATDRKKARSSPPAWSASPPEKEPAEPPHLQPAHAVEVVRRNGGSPGESKHVQAEVAEVAADVGVEDVEVLGRFGHAVEGETVARGESEHGESRHFLGHARERFIQPDLLDGSEPLGR